MKKQILQYFLLIIPLIFFYFGFQYSDISYYFFGAITFLLILFFINLKGISFNLSLPKVDYLRRHYYNSHDNIKLENNKPRKNTRMLILSRFIVLFLSVLLFTWITRFQLFDSRSTNILENYYISQVSFFGEKLYLLLLLLPIFLIGLFLNKSNKKEINFLKLVKSLSIITSLIFLGFNIALLFSFLLSVLEVNVFIYKINFGVSKYKIIASAKDIRYEIIKRNSIPQLARYGKDYKKNMVLAKLSSKRGFYELNILNNLPSNIFNPLKTPNSSMILFDDYLVISDINRAEIQLISPAIGKILVKKTFTDKNIKDEPQVDVLGRQEYLKLREDQINEELDEVDAKINEVEKEIGIVYGYISSNKNAIQKAQNNISSANNLKEQYYNTCITAGYTSYITGAFYRYYSDSECNSRRASWDGVIQENIDYIKETEGILKHNQGVVYQYQQIKKFLESTYAFVESTKEITPYELGVFYPENKIKVALDSNNPKVLTNFLATLTHEYLHYTSYISEERALDNFFEEGLTEYFARKVIRQQLKEETKEGYPVTVKVISEIVNKIPEKELLNIYMTKDQTQLEYLLDDAYGKDFYKDTELYFSTINYLPVNEALKVANNIMLRIGGKKLEESDVK